jgi:Ni/Co efflux regulator RcnB
MKRLVLAAVALSFVAGSVLQAEAAPMTIPAVAPAASSVLHVDWKKPARYDERRHYDRRDIKKKQAVRKHQWKRGQRYSDWRRHQPVRDYSRHGLKRPGQGQQWIKVGNDYLLVGIASGIIGAMIAGR